LLGLLGDNSFANYSEANRAFGRQTVLPPVTRVQKNFQAWLRRASEASAWITKLRRASRARYA
jgi:phage portal protein BeeE